MKQSKASDCRCEAVTFSVATVTQTAGWRFSKVVNIESTTVCDFDLSFPIATLIAPVEANSATHLLVVTRETSLKPARCMCAATVFGDTVSWHVVSCQSTEAIPSLRESSVTEERTVTLCNGPVCMVQPFVVSALWSLGSS